MSQDIYSLFISEKIFLGNSINNEFINGGVLVDIDTGKILRIFKSNNEVKNYKNNCLSVKIHEFGNKILMPGLIDSHVHINDPGRADWEGFTTATKAAAVGGFTTIVDMPLNSIPPTTTVENLKIKINVALKKIYVDVGFWGGVIPNNSNEIVKLVENGVVGFKCFLCDSGVDEFPKAERQDVERALEKMENLDTFLAFHAESDCPSSHKQSTECTDDPTKFKSYLKTRPAELEISAIEMIAELTEKYKNIKMHIVHLSSAESLPIIRKIRKNSPGKLTVETCHHYLCLDANNVPDKHTEFKCCPPIRDNINRNKLWQAIKDGDIDMVVSDHSPSTPEVKLLIENNNNYGNFLKAWGGISSVQFGLSLFWTNCQQYDLKLHDLHRLMCENPAKQCGFNDRKGKIQEGYDGDFCIWDPEAELTILKDDIQFKNKITPYENMKLKGVVEATVLRGKIIYNKSQNILEPFGKCLLRNEKENNSSFFKKNVL